MSYNYIYLNPAKPGRYCYEGLNISFLFKPLYVGKGTGGRIFKHLQEAMSERRGPKVDFIRMLLNNYSKDFIKSFVIKFNTSVSNKAAGDNEIKFIAAIGRRVLKTGLLFNVLDGGIGGGLAGELNQMYGKKQSEKTRRLIGEKARIRMKGKPANCSMLGKNHSEETKARMSAAAKGVPKSAEAKRKSSETRIKNGTSAGAKNGRAIHVLVTSPSGEEFELAGGFVKFCKERKLNYNRLSEVLKGKRTDWRDWKVTAHSEISKIL